MKTFLNEEQKRFKDLSDEEMLAIVKAKIAGQCEVLLSTKEWANSFSEILNVENIYRTKPPKQLVIPWAALRKDIKYVAMDKNGGVYCYSQHPSKSANDWFAEGVYAVLSNLLTIDTDGIDWETSLVTRPEGI